MWIILRWWCEGLERCPLWSGIGLLGSLESAGEAMRREMVESSSGHRSDTVGAGWARQTQAPWNGLIVEKSGTRHRKPGSGLHTAVRSPFCSEDSRQAPSRKRRAQR